MLKALRKKIIVKLSCSCCRNEPHALSTAIFIGKNLRLYDDRKMRNSKIILFNRIARERAKKHAST